MRRRMREGLVPAGLAQPDLPEYEDDLSLPFSERHARWQTWWDAFESWRTERAGWAARHGWPGGDTARVIEECEVPIPDEPFDPTTL